MFRRWIGDLRPNLLLLGPRRAGKTTLLRSLYPEWNYVTLDDFDVLGGARKDPKGLIQELSPRVIIDEVQRVPSLTLAIKQAVDENKLEVLLTGSSGLKLLDSSADTLAGRIDIRHLPTMAWGEESGLPADPKAIPGPLAVAEAQRSLGSAVQFGGFPEVVSSPDAIGKANLLKRYRDTYFIRDVAQMANIEHAEGLLAILHHLALCIGSPVDYSALARACHLSVPTVRKYLGVLQYADLIFKVLPFDVNPVKRLIKAGKFYFADNGILTALGAEISAGQRMENFVVSEVEKRRKIGILDCEQLYFYRTVHGAEVDLVFRHDSLWVGVEIKSGAYFDSGDSRNLRAFVSRSEGRFGILFYSGDQVIPVAQNAYGVPICYLKAGGWLANS